MLIIGWWIALPGVPTRAGALVAAVLVLGALKAAIWWGAPVYGLDSVIVPIETESVDLPDAPPSRRGVDPALDFQGDTFPVHFFNDIRSFNFYTPNQPKRDLLPFEATWRGLLVVARWRAEPDAGGERPGHTRAWRRATSSDRAVRPRARRDAHGEPAGGARPDHRHLPPARRGYALAGRPDGPADADGPALAGDQLVRAGTSAATVARDVWLRPLAWIVDGLLVGVMALAAGAHLLSVLGRSRATGASPARAS